MKMKQVLATGAALSMALSMAPVTASAADKVDINVIAAQYGQQTADWWANFVTEFNYSRKRFARTMSQTFM